MEDTSLHLEKLVSGGKSKISYAAVSQHDQQAANE
jgi:hypothetical protein